MQFKTVSRFANASGLTHTSSSLDALGLPKCRCMVSSKSFLPLIMMKIMVFCL